MDNATSGSVLFDGKDITKLKSHELAIMRLDERGFIFQRMYMMKYLTILDNGSKKTSESKKERKN